MKTAIVYARVSSREQAEGFSIDAQIKACENKGKDENYNVLKIFKDEGFTGTNKDRPALNELIRYCRDNTVSVVIVHKVDRFARSIVDHSAIRAVLMKHGTNLISCTEQLGTAPHEIFLENIMASMAQYYSDNLKTEVKKGLLERFESGYHLSLAPYGYEMRNDSKVMKPAPLESEIVKKIFSLYVTGKYSFRAIADMLFKENMKTKKGKKFANSRIQDILKNVVYMGQVEYKAIGRKTQGLHEPIVSPTVFLLAREIMEERGNVKKIQKGTYEFLYKGFISCPTCEKEMYVAYSTGGSGKKHLYYCCRSSDHKTLNIKAKDVQKAFLKLLENLRISDEVMEIVDEFVGDRLKEQEKEAGKAVKECEKAVEKIESERINSYKDMKRGLLSEESLKRVLSDLDDQQTLAQVALNEEKIDYYDLLTQLHMLTNFGSQIDRYWEISSFETRREILSSMLTNAPTFVNNELTNVQISPLYKALRDISKETILYGRGDRTRTCDLAVPNGAF